MFLFDLALDFPDELVQRLLCLFTCLPACHEGLYSHKGPSTLPTGCVTGVHND